MAKKTTIFSQDLAFYRQLWEFYVGNRGKIRSRYNSLTKKFLAYNDSEDNPHAFLRKPQFEALEIYVFIKEFMGNPQVSDMFDEWANQKGRFAEGSYYVVDHEGRTLFNYTAKDQNEALFKQMKKYQETYPNYIYALAMGLGKTILMATCIFYEFLLANKYPKDSRFCHNAVVFAPDKTVLASLHEIETFDKSKVVPPEYVRVLDSNIKFHYLLDGDSPLNTIDGSDFNIVISNNQKIIVKKKRTREKPAETLFSPDPILEAVYGRKGLEAMASDEESLITNQRFERLCRLSQLGVYVDEAHHLFGANLEKELRAGKGQKTTLRNTINMLARNTSVVACYNYTGTPYVKQQVLPEVVYAYGLRESIANEYLKDADPIGYENVKNEDFLRDVVQRFWEKYGGHTYEGLLPKLAIFAAGVDEAVNVVRPIVEQELAALGIPLDTILVNTGDPSITKDEDIRNFNNLDVPGTEGSRKQFIILVEKGREGWNCRSLLGVALFRSPKSKVFVLQSTMRCLRKLTDQQLTATVFLSKENYDILDDELRKNYNMEITDMANGKRRTRHIYQVHVLPPPRVLRMKKIWHEYSLLEKKYEAPVRFHLDTLDETKYESTLYEKGSLRVNFSVKAENIDAIKDQVRYSFFTLVGEISRYMNLPCLFISRILRESADGPEVIVAAVNRHNEILEDVVIPTIFDTLYEVHGGQKSKEEDVVLLHPPRGPGGPKGGKGPDYYEFSADPNLVLDVHDPEFTKAQARKSFHADTYCFDSKPEVECFRQYMRSPEVKEVYFTGMFTAGQGDLSIPYYDPESRRLRHYYPDFLAKMADGTYQLIEVKGDNKIDDEVVQAKKAAADEIAAANGISYLMYPGSVLMSHNVLTEAYHPGWKEPRAAGTQVLPLEGYASGEEKTGRRAAEETTGYGSDK